MTPHERDPNVGRIQVAGGGGGGVTPHEREPNVGRIPVICREGGVGTARSSDPSREGAQGMFLGWKL